MSRTQQCGTFLLSTRAFAAYTFYHIIQRVQFKAFWKGYHWYFCLLKTIGASAPQAIEMRVHIIDRAMMLVIAKLVTSPPAAILYAMHKMLFIKKAQRTEDGRFWYCRQQLLKFRQR